MILIVQQKLGRDGQNNMEEFNLKVGMKKLGGNFGLQCSNLFAGLPLGAKGSRFSPRLSKSTAIVGSVL